MLARKSESGAVSCSVPAGFGFSNTAFGIQSSLFVSSGPPDPAALPSVGSPVPVSCVSSLVSPESPDDDSDPRWPISDSLRDFAFQTVVFRSRSLDSEHSNIVNYSFFDCP